jgi:hypothetical protein
VQLVVGLYFEGEVIIGGIQGDLGPLPPYLGTLVGTPPQARVSTREMRIEFQPWQFAREQPVAE